ncbi:MAG: toxin-antitoxin system HicB family antitoxin [Acidobacteriota bacterium]
MKSISKAQKHGQKLGYPMRVSQVPDSGEWVAEVIDLPGCIGVGATAEEAVETASAAVPEWVAEARAAGWEVPTPHVRAEASGKFVVRLPRSLHERLQNLADEESTSLNQLVVWLLSEGVSTKAVAARLESHLAALKEAQSGCPVALAWSQMLGSVGFSPSGKFNAWLAVGSPMTSPEFPPTNFPFWQLEPESNRATA